MLKILLYLLLPLVVLVLSTYYMNVSSNGIGEERVLKMVSFVMGPISRLIKLMNCEKWISDSIGEAMFKKFNSDGLKVDYVKYKDIEFTLFEPKNLKGNSRRTIIYIHGGGWIHFSPRFYSNITGEIAKSLNAVVISLNYRKAPEFPFPHGISDIRRAVHFILKHHHDFQIDLRTLTIMGDSAGGNLGLALCYELHRERDKLMKIDSDIRFNLVLLSPTLQMFDLNLPSFRENNQDLVLTKNKMCSYICLYTLGKVHENECIDYICANAHIQKEAYGSSFKNVDWQKYLKGPDYDDRKPSSFPLIHSTDQNRQMLSSHPDWVLLHQKNIWSSYLNNPTYSPLSALNDRDLLTILPRNIVVFNALKDPLRDDARLFYHRVLHASTLNYSFTNLPKFKNVKLIELNTSHDPIGVLVFGMSKSWEQLRLLKAEYEMMMRN